MHRLIGLLLTTMVLGCGGDDSSGVDGAKLVINMTPGELDQYCSWAVDTAGGPRTVMCGDGVTVTITPDTKAECIAEAPKTTTNPMCMATVAQAEACFVAFLDADPCTLALPPACAPVATAACN